MVSFTLLLAGCRSEPETDWQIGFIEPELRWTDAGLDFVAGVELDPSPAMLEAMERGVTVTFLVALRASSGRVWLPVLDERRRHRFRISYLPLIRHYQLRDLHNDTQSTYPRLNMLVRELREPRTWSIPLAGDESLSLVRARIRLDRTRLPSPMRLPTWFESQWRLDSGWQSFTTPDRGVTDDR